MKTTIDAAGRVVIPRAARDAAHLVAGTELDVRVENGVVRLEPAVKPARLIKRGGLVVAHMTEPFPPLKLQEVNETLDEVRRAGSRRKS
jgi:AbrB family looped-hinge helix DNA binding protein